MHHLFCIARIRSTKRTKGEEDGQGKKQAAYLCKAPHTTKTHKAADRWQMGRTAFCLRRSLFYAHTFEDIASDENHAAS